MASASEHPDENAASDSDLVAGMSRGEVDALAALYDRYSAVVLAVVRRVLKGEGQAEDLVHDVFLESWRRAADYDPNRGSVRTWLVLRARSRALDYQKSAAVARRVTLPERSWSALADSFAADHTLAPDCARLRQALAALPQEQRQVLFLGYFEGLSSSEIAQRVGTPVGTVKSRVASAMARLRRALAGSQGERDD